MGHGSSKLEYLRKAIRDNDAKLTEVDLSGVQLSDKAVRKLSEALRRNRCAYY